MLPFPRPGRGMLDFGANTGFSILAGQSFALGVSSASFADMFLVETETEMSSFFALLVLTCDWLKVTDTAVLV